MAKDTAKSSGGRVTPQTTGRYTPPVPKEVKVSPRWVPVLMGVLLVLGAAVILLNYVSVLPGSVTNWYLLLGLPGQVFLDQGEELGLEEADVPGERRQDPVFLHSEGRQAGRDGCRVPWAVS